MGSVHHLHRGPVLLRSDNIKSVRPITDDHLRAIFDVRPDLYDSLEERLRIEAVVDDVRRDLRAMRLQRFVKWACVLLAYAAIVFFAFQLGRGVVTANTFTGS